MTTKPNMLQITKEVSPVEFELYRKGLRVSDHAIKQYRKRVGSKGQSPKKVIDLINRSIRKELMKGKAARVYNHNKEYSIYPQKRIKTDDFRAVVSGNQIVTILNNYAG